MRTTIEIKDNLRSELLKRAARQGEKGFSHIIEQALESFFALEKDGASTRKKALALKGSLSAKEAGQLRAQTAQIRENWRQ